MLIIIAVFVAGFWSAVAALAAKLFGWPVLPVTLVTGMVSAFILTVVVSICQAAGTQIPNKENMEVEQFYFESPKARQAGVGFVPVQRQ